MANPEAFSPKPESSSLLLPARDFGTHPEGVPLKIIPLIIDVGEHQITLNPVIWERDKDNSYTEPKDFKGEALPTKQRSEQLVVLSGFAATALEMAFAYPSFGQHWNTVVGLDHPEAPTATITPPEKPLNTESFANSGYVELRAIEKLIDNGVLQPGVTVLGYSTGGVVMLEAIAQDIREAEATGRQRYIKNAVLFNSPGMQERENLRVMMKGIGQSMKPYFGEYARDVYKRFRRSLKRNGPAPAKQKGPDLSMSFKELQQHILEARQKPEWKSILGMNIWFDRMEYLAGKLRIHALMAQFHRVWPNQHPHFLPPSPSRHSAEQLVFHDITKDARTAIYDTPILLYFGMDDKGIPPQGFLSHQDLNELEQINLVDEDIELMHKLNQQILDQYNEQRKQKDLSPYTFETLPRRKRRKLYTSKDVLSWKQAEEAEDRIVANIKKMFPHNADSVHVRLMIGGNHITPRSSVPDLAAMSAVSGLTKYDPSNTREN